MEKCKFMLLGGFKCSGLPDGHCLLARNEGVPDGNLNLLETTLSNMSLR